MEADMKKVYENHAENIIDASRDALGDEKIRGITARHDADYNVTLRLRNPEQAEQARGIIRRTDPALQVETGDGEGTIYIPFTDVQRTELLNKTVSQLIEVVRRRVDATGTTEPIIVRQGEQRILLQVPGVTDTARIKELLNTTASLSFHLVDERATNTGRRRAGIEILEFDDESIEQKLGVEKRARIKGDMIQSASAGFSEGQPIVSIRLNSLGAKYFCDISRENVGRPFAIVLDNKVLSAPSIREPICGGVMQISGNFTVQEVNNLALLLRAGALPTSLEFVEERTVGPSLGADSIEAGKKASVVALIAVVAFMIIVYGLYGVFACVALTVNIALIFAMLSALQATLTLPGIAGIVLTIGMAVDANVLIFERIREEYQSGRSLMNAIDAGYSRAMSTITDANITTLIAAILLYSFGTGPVKGFAVTLAIGILTSLFSAVMVTRLMVVIWLTKGKKKDELPLH
jgi:protein-export membrane protein SecD